MKKLFVPLLAILFLTSCGIDSMSDMQPNQTLEEQNAVNRTDFSGQAFTDQNGAGTTAADMNLERFKVIDEYEILGTDDDGLATGFILKEGVPAVITASGLVGFYFAGQTDPSTPNGRADAGIYNSFPVVSLVARVGGGELQFVGEGPTELTGSGEVVFYINDTFFEDNDGSYTIQISYYCYPGFGIGDANHYHCK